MPPPFAGNPQELRQPVEHGPRRPDWRLVVALLVMPVVIIVIAGIRAVVNGTSSVPPSPSPAPAPTQLSTFHTPSPVTPVPTPGVTLAPPIPSGREMTAMAYDPWRDDVVMFGGGGFSSGGISPSRDDTWTFDSAGWHERHPTTTPPALNGALMTDDPTTHELLLIGAVPPSDEVVQTWGWNGQSWTRRSDLPAHEQPISIATLVAPAQVVLITFAQSPAGTPPPTATHTWVFDGTAWALNHPVTALPLGGAGPLLVSDAAHRRVLALVSTGADESPHTWSWDGASWSQLIAPNQPPYDPITSSAAEDPYSGDVVLYMGGGDSGNGGVTWILDANGWHLADAISPAFDTDYHGAQLLADPNLRALIVIANAGRPNPLNALWTFTGAHWVAVSPSALGAPRAPAGASPSP